MFDYKKKIAIVLQSWKGSSKYFLLVNAIAVLLIFAIGPLDYFSHGYFSEEINFAEVAANGITGYFDLGEKDYETKFKPQKKHFAGFEINLANQPQGNSGEIYLEIRNQKGKIVDLINIDLSRVSEGEWYIAYANKNLSRNQIYTLQIRAKNCETYPYLQMVTPQFKAQESIEGDLLIKFAYKESTFSMAEKCFIILLIIAVIIFINGSGTRNIKLAVLMKKIAVFLLLVIMLSWNYMYNVMDSQNTTFDNFQSDSESVVKGPIYALQDGIGNDAKYGLAAYMKKDIQVLTDDNWTNGYSNAQSAICLFTNDYIRRVAVIGNIVQFENGSRMSIRDVSIDDQYACIYFETQEILNETKFGDLNTIQFITQDGMAYGEIIYSEYSAQYGLQGKVFRYFSQGLKSESIIECYNVICCVTTAFVFIVIIALIQRKYNNLLAGCFFVGFWLSPWIVNFSRNLYWVEFTWFIPMAFGLLCSWKIREKKVRVLSYFGIFISVLIKSLCGYEYISVIMMGAIAFLLVDLVKAIFEKQRKDEKLLLKSILIIGGMALLGFFMAICIHARLRGNGSVLEGIRSIIVNDVLRRTNGADLNNYSGQPWYILSLTASIWETLCLYFHFSTEVITGLSGNLFPVLCILPVAIIISDIINKKIDYEKIALYIIFFWTSISWFVLAKAHSYIHVHMNYVLWYFGFVQVCFYIIIDKLIDVFKKSNEVNKES